MRHLVFRVAAISLTAFLGAALVWLNRPAPAPVSTMEESRPVSDVRLSADGVTFVVTGETGPLAAGVPVQLSLATPAGPVSARATSSGEPLVIELPYVRAGLTPYRLRVGDTLLEGSFQRAPGPPVSPLQIKLGARAAQVASERAPSLIVHPLDKQGNVSESPVAIVAQYPQDAPWQRSLTVDHLLAWTYVPVGRSVGTVQISAFAEGARGERAEVDVLPGTAVRARFEADTANAPATGRDVWRLELAGGRDAFANRLGDGAAVTFSGGSAEDKLYLVRPFVQGTAPLTLPTYPRAGAYDVRATTGRYRSEELVLTADDLDIGEMPLGWRSLEPLELGLGPVYERSGALVDDGTLVTLSVMGVGGPLVRFSEPLNDGELRWRVPPVPRGAETLRIDLGSRSDYLDLPGRPFP